MQKVTAFGKVYEINTDEVSREEVEAMAVALEMNLQDEEVQELIAHAEFLQDLEVVDGEGVFRTLALHKAIETYLENREETKESLAQIHDEIGVNVGKRVVLGSFEKGKEFKAVVTSLILTKQLMDKVETYAEYGYMSKSLSEEEQMIATLMKIRKESEEKADEKLKEFLN